MYEYTRKIRRRGMYGLGDDAPTPGQSLVLDYRAGAKTLPEVQATCRGVRPVSRFHTDYDECRWFLTPEELCRLENGGRNCTDEQLRQQCFMTPDNLRHNRCFFYMDNMTTEEAQASNAGPEVDPSLRRATGAVAQYRERVAQATENIVRTLRPTDPQVQALQQTMISAGCSLPRYGADGRWGTETETALQCLVGRQGWTGVLQQYPWIAQRVTVPTQAVASAKPAGAASTIVVSQAPAPAGTSAVQTASILPALTIPGLPPWATWVVAGVGLVSLIALGAYLTRGR
jgi:hypothetical protein